MQKMYYTIILLLSATTISYAMDKKETLATQIDSSIASKKSNQSEIIINTVSIDEDTLKAIIRLMQKERAEVERIAAIERRPKL